MTRFKAKPLGRSREVRATVEGSFTERYIDTIVFIRCVYLSLMKDFSQSYADAFAIRLAKDLAGGDPDIFNLDDLTIISEGGGAS